jgi:phospholipase A1
MRILSALSTIPAILVLSVNVASAAHSSYSVNGQGPVVERVYEEDKIPANYFGIAFHKPTYILPYYYTGSPDTGAYLGTTPNGERLKHAEIKYQVSLKAPIWKHINNSQTSLYLAYTQLSYWQLYNRRSFFRESNYEPELFAANELNFPLYKDWRVNFVNPGLVHQSNGLGNELERSWNRLYLEIVTSTDNWMINIKPWYVISENGRNQDITNYLGYGRFLVAYKFCDQVISVQAHNLIEGGGRHATAELTWSFPLTPYMKGYVDVFSGYGQSLIEYNHRTNSAGVGIAFNDWI